MIEYPFNIRRLDIAEGGGYLAEAIDLNSCIADGETVQEAIDNLQDAIISWTKTAHDLEHDVPLPSDSVRFSGKWVVRTPKTLHRRLVEQSRNEGVSLNTLVVSLLSEGLGSKTHLGQRDFTDDSR